MRRVNDEENLPPTQKTSYGFAGYLDGNRPKLNACWRKIGIVRIDIIFLMNLSMA